MFRWGATDLTYVRLARVRSRPLGQGSAKAMEGHGPDGDGQGHHNHSWRSDGYDSSPRSAHRRPSQHGSHAHRQHGRGGHGARPRGPREAHFGTVVNLKDSYGFINAYDSSHLFFHFSQILPAGDHVEPGDAVRFCVRDDPRTGRQCATSVEKVSQEELRALDVDEERLVGNVVVAPHRRRHGGDMSGLVEVKLERPDGLTESLPFGEGDMDASSSVVHLHRGDIVEFSLGVARMTRKRQACRVVYLETTLPRLQGVIYTVKESFGFIVSPETTDQFFFHFSELAPELDPNGEETLVQRDVSFNVVDKEEQPAARGRDRAHVALCAARVQPLPRGVVVWAEPLAGRFVGKVTQAHVPRKGDRSWGFEPPAPAGRLVCAGIAQDQGQGASAPAPAGAAAPAEAQVVEVEVHEGRAFRYVRESPFGGGTADEGAPNPLRPGTEVYFSLCRHRPSGSVLAYDVEETHRGPPLVEERGVISVLKGKFGFVQCQSVDARAFFNMAHIDPDVASRLRVGSCVQITHRERTGAQTHHQAGSCSLEVCDLQLLPDGAVELARTLQTDVDGLVRRTPSKNKPGLIACGEALTQEMEQLALGPDPRQLEKQGAHGREAKTKAELVSSWRIPPAEAAAPAPAATLAPAGDGVPSAPVADMHGDGVRDSEAGVSGQAPSTAPSTAETAVGSAPAPASGPASTARPDTLTFTAADVVGGARLQVGERVTFTMVELVYNGHRAAQDVRPKLYEGVVDNMKGSYGERGPSCPLRWEFGWGETSSLVHVCLCTGFLRDSVNHQTIFFHVTEVGDGVHLRAGDRCTFVLMLNTKNRQMTAGSVVRIAQVCAKGTSAHTVTGPRSDWSAQRPHCCQAAPSAAPSRPQVLQITRKAGEVGAGVIRQAQGPDGSRGFARKRSSQPPLPSPLVQPAAAPPASTDAEDAAEPAFQILRLEEPAAQAPGGDA